MHLPGIQGVLESITIGTRYHQDRASTVVLRHHGDEAASARKVESV